MKINRIFGMLIAALMVVGVPAQSLSAASATPQVTAEISRGCAAVERSVKGSPACAAALEKGLSADPANLKTFQDAAKANDNMPKPINRHEARASTSYRETHRHKAAAPRLIGNGIRLLTHA